MSALDDLMEECRKQNIEIEKIVSEPQPVVLVVRVKGNIEKWQATQIHNLVRTILDEQGCKVPVLVIDSSIDVFSVRADALKEPSQEKP